MTVLVKYCFSLYGVSIHTPTWGVTQQGAVSYYRGIVSIHTPTWGVTFVIVMFVDVTVVSIHTPTWGVTEVSRVKRWEAEVSIHTPTWGVTSTSLTRCCNSSFQSTHLHEVWLMFGSPKCWGDCVSIHTPTWGVTINTMLMVDVASVSIHTPTWGVTIEELIDKSGNWFQSTHLHEVWRDNTWKRTVHKIGFNPHTYMRCDNA